MLGSVIYIPNFFWNIEFLLSAFDIVTTMFQLITL